MGEGIKGVPLEPKSFTAIAFSDGTVVESAGASKQVDFDGPLSHPSRTSNQFMMVSQTRLLALALMSTLMLLVVDARYLPTRSDDLQKDHIRDILRGLFEKAEFEKSASNLLADLGSAYTLRGGAPLGSDMGAYAGSRAGAVRSGLLSRDMGA